MSTSQNALWSDPQVVAGYKSIERVTGPVGELLLKQSGILSSQEDPLVVLDNACGTGVISTALYKELNQAQKSKLRLTCGDVTTGMLEYMEHIITTNQWAGAVAKYIDAQETGLPDNIFTHVFTNFGWQTIPKNLKAVEECFRILRPNGIYAATTWEHLGWIEVIQDTIATIPGTPECPTRPAIMQSLSEGTWDNKAWVKRILEEQGFIDVRLSVKSQPLHWKNLQELMDTSFPKMMTMSPAKLWSEKDQEKFGPLLIPALEKFLLDRYGRDQPFEFKMVAILATARKPGQ